MRSCDARRWPPDPFGCFPVALKQGACVVRSGGNPIRTILLLIAALTLAAAPAFAGTPPEPVHWTIGTDDRGDFAMTDDQIVRFDSERLREGSVLTTQVGRGGHQILAGLFVPAEIGPPDAHGAKLEFAGIDDPNIRVTLLDNDAAVTDVGCVSPPDPVLPPNPCVAAFPAGHTLTVIQSNRNSATIDVTMPGEDGTIIPCVRVVVQGPFAIEGVMLSFAGDMHLNAQGVDDPNL